MPDLNYWLELISLLDTTEAYYHGRWVLGCCCKEWGAALRAEHLRTTIPTCCNLDIALGVSGNVEVLNCSYNDSAKWSTRENLAVRAVAEHYTRLVY